MKNKIVILNSKFIATGLSSIAAAIFINGCASTSGNASQPMLAILEQFESAPAKGPDEAAVPFLKPPTNAVAANWPGNGLAQHPFLFYGEGVNVLYVVNHGKVVWTYAFPRGGEIDDAWMLSNGHIICTKMTDCYVPLPPNMPVPLTVTLPEPVPLPLILLTFNVPLLMTVLPV